VGKAGHFDALVESSRIGLKLAQPSNGFAAWRLARRLATWSASPWVEALAEADIAVAKRLTEKFKLRLCAFAF